MSIALRPAAPADIGFLMQAERGPGYDQLVGQSSAAQHQAFLDDPSGICLVAAHGEVDGGFIWLSGLTDRHNGICMKRIVAANPGGGFGSAMVAAGLDWVFATTAAHRVWLDTLRHNERAAHVYRKLGFIEEGIFREAYQMPDGTHADRIVFSILRREWLSA